MAGLFKFRKKSSGEAGGEGAASKPDKSAMPLNSGADELSTLAPVSGCSSDGVSVSTSTDSGINAEASLQNGALTDSQKGASADSVDRGSADSASASASTSASNSASDSPDIPVEDSAEIASLKRHLAIYEFQIDTLRSELEQFKLNAILSGLGPETALNPQTIQKMILSIPGFNKSIDSKIEELENTIASLQSENEAFKNKIEELLKKAEENLQLKKTISELDDHIRVSGLLADQKDAETQAKLDEAATKISEFEKVSSHAYQLETELEALRSELTPVISLSEENKRLFAMIASLEDSLQEASSKSEIDLAEKSYHLEIAAARISTLENEASDSAERNNILNRRAESLDKNVAYLQAENEALNTKLAETEETLAALSEQFEQASQERKLVAESAAVEMAALKERLRGFDLHVIALNAAHSETLEEKTKELEADKKQVAKLEFALSALRSETGAADSILSENSKLKEKIAALEKTLCETDSEGKSIISSQALELETAAARISALESEAVDISSRSILLTKKISGIENENASLLLLNATLEKKLSEYDSLTAKFSDSAKEQAAAFEALSAELERKSFLLIDAVRESDRLKSEIAGLNAQVAALNETSLSEVNTTSDMLRKSAARIAELETAFSTLRSESSFSAEKISTLSAENSTLISRMKDLEQSLHEAITGGESLIASKTHELNSANETIFFLEAKLTEANRNRELSEGETKSQAAASAVLRTEIGSLKSEIESLNNRMDEILSVSEMQKNLISEKNREVESSAAKVRQLSDYAAEFKKTLAAFEDFKSSTHSLKLQAETLTADNETLKAEIAALTDKLSVSSQANLRQQEKSASAITRLETRIAQLSAETVSAPSVEAANAGLKENIATLENLLISEKAEYQAAMNERAAELQTADAKINELELKISELNSKYSNALQQDEKNATLKNKIETVEKRIAEKTLVSAMFKTAEEPSNERRETKTHEIKSTTGKSTANFLKNLDEKNQEVEKLLNDVANLRKMVKELRPEQT